LIWCYANRMRGGGVERNLKMHSNFRNLDIFKRGKKGCPNKEDRAPVQKRVWDQKKPRTQTRCETKVFTRRELWGKRRPKTELEVKSYLFSKLGGRDSRGAGWPHTWETFLRGVSRGAGVKTCWKTIAS